MSFKNELLDSQVFTQLSVYGLVGVMSNIIGYGLYLLLTFIGFPVELAMTLVYMTGSFVGFIANRNLTFRHRGEVGSAGVRYAFAQLIGYILNYFMLALFVSHYGFPHQAVQAVAIIFVAGVLFVLNKLFVFRRSRE